MARPINHDRQRTTGSGFEEWHCTKCGEWKPLSGFSLRHHNPAKPRAHCRTCASGSSRYVPRPRQPAIPPVVIGEDVITPDDMREFHMQAADTPLSSTGFHCGRRTVIVMMALDNRIEYGVWCAVCDVLWRSGV